MENSRIKSTILSTLSTLRRSTVIVRTMRRMRRAARTSSQPLPTACVDLLYPTLRTFFRSIFASLIANMCTHLKKQLISQVSLSQLLVRLPSKQSSYVSSNNCANLATRTRLRWRITAYRVRADASGDESSCRTATPFSIRLRCISRPYQ